MSRTKYLHGLVLLHLIIELVLIVFFLGDLFPKEVDTYLIIVQPKWYQNLPILTGFTLVLLYFLACFRKEVSILYALGVFIPFLQILFVLDTLGVGIWICNLTFFTLWRIARRGGWQS